MAEKTELTLHQMYGFKALGPDGLTEFTFSDASGNEVTITCKQNYLPSLIGNLNQLYQDAYALAKKRPLN